MAKTLDKAAITREDYAKDPQAVLDVLEFYIDHQKREMEELGLYPNSRPGTSGTSSTLSPSTLSPYPQTSSAPRFNANQSLLRDAMGVHVNVSKEAPLASGPS